jgi:hypothetical protein
MPDDNLELFKTPWGIDAMEILDKETKTQIEQFNNELSLEYEKCFSTPAGQKVLQHLKHCTLDQPTWIPDAKEPINSGFIREGQNSVVRNILTRINNSKSYVQRKSTTAK